MNHTACRFGKLNGAGSGALKMVSTNKYCQTILVTLYDNLRQQRLAPPCSKGVCHSQCLPVSPKRCESDNSFLLVEFLLSLPECGVRTYAGDAERSSKARAPRLGPRPLKLGRLQARRNALVLLFYGVLRRVQLMLLRTDGHCLRWASASVNSRLKAQGCLARLLVSLSSRDIHATAG